MIASEDRMKQIYHQMVAKRTSTETHKIEHYATMVGQAVTCVEQFRKLEAQARPLTKHIGGKKKKARKVSEGS